MRVMVLIKATEESEAGVMPSEELLTRDGQVQRGAGQGGRDARGRGAAPELKGVRVAFSGGERKVIDGPFAETKELIAGYWLWQVKSMDEAIEWVKRMPNPDGGERGRDRDPPGVRGRRLRRRAHARAARAGGAPARAGRGEPVAGGWRDDPGRRRQPHDRRRLADRVRAADRRARPDRARRRPRRGPRAGGARRRARAVARVGRPGQPGRLADGHRQAPGDRPPAPRRGARAQDARSWGARSRSSGERGPRPRRREIDDPFGDDLLRLIFTTCHPVLSTEARVALTLRLLGGLTTEEIARAFLVPEATVAQRIVRAKRTLSAARVPFEVPERDELAGRLASVLEVIYLIFNEGYAATAGDDWMRPELCEEALRLGRILAELLPRSRRCTASSR